MLLLAGDLFHENKPSRGSLHQTIALMREYCMGSKPIALEVVSDVGIGLQTGYECVETCSSWQCVPDDACLTLPDPSPRIPLFHVRSAYSLLHPSLP